MTGADAEPTPPLGLTRKFLHLSAATIPVCWGLGLVETGTVRGGLTIAAGVALTAELLRRRNRWVANRFDAVFGRWLKPHERTHITGATWLAFSMLLAVLVFPPAAARAALLAGAVGDAAAALVGSALVGSARSRRDGAKGKSIAGALACATTTALAAWWLAPATWGVAATLGAVAAAAEWPARFGDDNVRVTLATGSAAWLLGVG